MTSSAFNRQFRPMVNAAWFAQCELTGRDHTDTTAKDRWYREALWSCCAIRTTKAATDVQQAALLSRFGLLSRGCAIPVVSGWTAAQNARFADLSAAAWQRQCRADSADNYLVWIDAILADAGVFHRIAKDRKASFDSAMAQLAVIANDTYWIERTASAGERRLLWQLEQFLADLSWLTGHPCDWVYVRGIWTQAKQLPVDISDSPIPQLVQVLQMLDTHVRRECRRRQIKPCDIPRRSTPIPTPVLIPATQRTA